MNDQNPWKDILTDKRKLFVVFSIVVPFLVYSVYYYATLIRHAPFRYDQFKGLEYRSFRLGKPRTVINSFTGEYSYYTRKDSLIHAHIQFDASVLKDIHEKMRDVLFWDIPTIAGDSSQKHRTDVTLVYLRVTYSRVSKQVWWQQNYFADRKLDERMNELSLYIQAMATSHQQPFTR